ncbi:MAG: diguanylate cyclase [Terriglobales bacterium]
MSWIGNSGFASGTGARSRSLDTSRTRSWDRSAANRFRIVTRKDTFCPGTTAQVTTTFRDGRALQNHVFTLHKQGHRLGVQVRTLPLLDDMDLVVGVAVAFEEAPAGTIPEASGSLMYGCLDPLTGVPSQRLTRAVLAESLAGLEETHGGLGLLRIRILGLKEFSAKYGADSTVPFLRASAQTIRHSLGPEDFLGRWGREEFLAVLQSGSPIRVAAAAESLGRLLRQSEVTWWGDRFRIETEVESAVARPGDTLESLLSHMKPSHAAVAAKAAMAGGAPDSAPSQG